MTVLKTIPAVIFNTMALASAKAHVHSQSYDRRIDLMVEDAIRVYLAKTDLVDRISNDGQDRLEYESLKRWKEESQ